MTPQEIKVNYMNIRNTLDAVEVRGANNMNHLLGCILAMDKLWPEIEKQLLNANLFEEATDAENQAG